MACLMTILRVLMMLMSLFKPAPNGREGATIAPPLFYLPTTASLSNFLCMSSLQRGP